MLLRIARAIAWHDLQHELRRPAMLSGVLLFSAGSLVAMHLALSGSGTPPPGVTAGALWMVIVYGALLGAGRVLASEREEGTWDVLMLAACDRTAVFLGKAAGAFLLAVLLHLVLVPLYLLLFGTPASTGGYVQLAASVLLADAGFALVGVLVGAVSLRARGRELLVAAMFLPLTLPVLVTAVAISLGAFGGAEGNLPQLLAFLVLYDAMFLSIGVAAFPELAVE